MSVHRVLRIVPKVFSDLSHEGRGSQVKKSDSPIFTENSGFLKNWETMQKLAKKCGFSCLYDNIGR